MSEAQVKIQPPDREFPEEERKQFVGFPCQIGALDSGPQYGGTAGIVLVTFMPDPVWIRTTISMACPALRRVLDRRTYRLISKAKRVKQFIFDPITAPGNLMIKGTMWGVDTGRSPETVVLADPELTYLGDDDD